MTLPIGTVLLSRWKKGYLNTTVGFWNHAAIVVSQFKIVEVDGSRAPVLTLMSEYLRRDIEWIPLIPVDPSAGKAAAEVAIGLIGATWRPRRGFRAVSAAFKIPYGKATNQEFPKVRKPDDIVLSGIFSS